MSRNSFKKFVKFHVLTPNCTLVENLTHIPREFARLPRSLNEVDRWKATEFRQFLLYTGPVSLLGHLPEQMYKNFLLLSVAVSVLLNPSVCSEFCDYAHELLVTFVTHFGNLYGKDMLTYNVHGLVHLANEVKKFGSLDNTSAFVFESFLGRLKRMIRKPGSPLEQIIRRISELSRRQEVKSESKSKFMQKEHHEGPVPSDCLSCIQFKELQWLVG